MSIMLIDSGRVDEQSNATYYKFDIEKYSHIKKHKLSKAFKCGGHTWKLQVSKTDDHFGMFMRWLGTKPGGQLHSQLWCSTAIEFSIINKYDPDRTICIGNLEDPDLYHTMKYGTGYSQVAELETLKTASGYVIDDKLTVTVRIKIELTVFQDKVQSTARPDRLDVESLQLPYLGALWSLTLFPRGEEDDNDDEETNNNRKVSLYLSRKLEHSNPLLRHRAKFSLYIEGGPETEQITKAFYDNLNAFGTGYLLSSKELKRFAEGGIVRVGVKFYDLEPFFNFGYEVIRGSNRPITFQDGIHFNDYRGIPWFFSLSKDSHDDESILAWLTLDPKMKSEDLLKLKQNSKCLEIRWGAEIFNFREPARSIRGVSSEASEIFTFPGDYRSISFPVSFEEIIQSDSPYLDDDSRLAVQLSLLECNFIQSDPLSPSREESDNVADLVSALKYEIQDLHEGKELSEKQWQNLLEIVEQEKDKIISEQKDEMEKVISEHKVEIDSKDNVINEQQDQLRAKELLVHSLKEKLEHFEQYIKSLEEGREQEIEEFQDFSITKLVEESKPEPDDVEQLIKLATLLEDIIKKDNESVNSVLIGGDLGQETLVKGRMKLDLVLYFKAEIRKKLFKIETALEDLKERITANKERLIKDGITSGQDLEISKTANALLLSFRDTIVALMPTKECRSNGGYRALYRLSMKAPKENWPRLMVSVTERQVQFVTKQQQKCKDLIRVVKRWCDKVEWKSVEHRPSSYLLTLLVIYAYQQLQDDSIALTPSFEKEVLTELAIHVMDEKLEIHWDDYYDPDDFPVNDPQLPSIRDPALPCHNVADTGIKDWLQFREELPEWVKTLCH